MTNTFSKSSFNDLELPPEEIIKTSVSAFTAGFVCLAAMTYLVGYVYEYVYFAKIGMPWVMDVLPLNQFMLRSVEFVAIVGFFSYLSIGRVAVSKIFLFDVIAVGVGLTIYLIVELLNLDASFRYEISILIYGIFAMAIGMALGDLILSFNKDVRIQYKVRLSVAICITLIASPVILASAKSRLDTDLALSLLPVAAIPHEPVGNWRLLRVIDGNYLLVALNAEPAKREFRLIPLNGEIKVLGSCPLKCLSSL